MTIETAIIIQMCFCILPLVASTLAYDDWYNRRNRMDSHEQYMKSTGRWRVYLAAPYSHKNPDVREARATVIGQMCAKLMLEGNVVFSPITHSHALIDVIPFEERTWEFFKWQDFSHIETCQELIVFCIPGWEDSRGVKDEISKARELGIKISFREYTGKILHKVF